MTCIAKKSLKMPKKMAISLTIACLTSFSVAHGEQYNGDGFSIEIPSDLVRAPSPHPNVVLVLRPKTQGFPTFNVVSESTSLKEDLSPEEFGELVLRGYKQVGFTDATIKSASVGADRWRAEILYTQGNEQFRAIVVGINAYSRHFILTFMDREVTIDRSRFLESSLTRSFVVKEPAAKDEPKSISIRGIAALLSLILTVVLLVYLIRKRPED